MYFNHRIYHELNAFFSSLSYKIKAKISLFVFAHFEGSQIKCIFPTIQFFFFFLINTGKCLLGQQYKPVNVNLS